MQLNWGHGNPSGQGRAVGRHALVEGHALGASQVTATHVRVWRSHSVPLWHLVVLQLGRSMHSNLRQGAWTHIRCGWGLQNLSLGHALIASHDTGTHSFEISSHSVSCWHGGQVPGQVVTHWSVTESKIVPSGQWQPNLHTSVHNSGVWTPQIGVHSVLHPHTFRPSHAGGQQIANPPDWSVW